MGLLLLQGIAKDHETLRSFAEDAQSNDERMLIQGFDCAVIGLDASPVDVRVRRIH